MSNDTDRRVVWRDRKLAWGLCVTCGKRPIALHQRTGLPTIRCAVCHAKMRRYDAQRRGMAA